MSDSLLIGVSPNQVPLNSMLGDLARMSLEELVAMVATAMTQRLSSTGLGAINDLRNTIFERGAPQDVFNTGMTTGLARAGTDGVGIPGFGTDEFGSLIVNAQWMDSSIGPAYNRIYFRSGRMWFQAMKTSTTWDSWVEVLTGGSKAIAALATISTVAADQIAFYTGANSAGTTNLSALGRSVIANTDLASMMATLGLTGLGVSADLRGNVYEKGGTPTTVINRGLSMGLARGGTDGLSIPAFGTTTNQYGTLLVMAGYNDLSGSGAYNRMFIRNGRLFIQPYSSNTAWGAWTELASNLSIDNAPWVTPTLLNSWTQYNAEFPLGYRKCAGHVQLKGVVKGGTIGQPIFTLPAGYRPPQKAIAVSFCQDASVGLVPNRLDIATDGNVYATGGSNGAFGLDNVWIPLA